VDELPWTLLPLALAGLTGLGRLVSDAREPLERVSTVRCVGGSSRAARTPTPSAACGRRSPLATHGTSHTARACCRSQTQPYRAGVHHPMRWWQFSLRELPRPAQRAGVGPRSPATTSANTSRACYRRQGACYRRQTQSQRDGFHRPPSNDPSKPAPQTNCSRGLRPVGKRAWFRTS
jgi:hypothetical protein